MTTTNGLSSVLQNYYRLQMQKTSTTGTPTAEKAPAAGTGAKTDTATISKEALQALLASQVQALSGTATSDPWAMPSEPDATGNGAWPATAATTPQEALQQSQQFMLKAQQSLLGSDSQSSSGSKTSASDNMSALMTTYMQTLNQQIAQTIQTAQARVAKSGS